MYDFQIQQPALPKYRIPFFAGLHKKLSGAMHIYYSASPGLPNHPAPEQLQCTPVLDRSIAPGLMYSSGQLRAARSANRACCLSWNSRYVSLPLAICSARQRRIGTVLWGHGYSKSETPSRRKLRLAIGKMADCIAVYSEGVKDRLVAYHGFDPERVYVPLNTIDQDPIQSARQTVLDHPEKQHEQLAQLDLLHKKILLFVSRLGSDNRLDLLLQSLPAVLSQHPDVVVAVVGDGDKELARLKEIAEQLGVLPAVRFLGAIYDEATLGPLFCAASAFVYPENIGLSVLHAMGYGLPVITADNIEAQNPEVEAILPGKTGILYEAGSAEALSRAVIELLSDEQMRTRIGTAARDHVLQKFTLDRMIAGMSEALLFAADRAASRKSR